MNFNIATTSEMDDSKLVKNESLKFYPSYEFFNKLVRVPNEIYVKQVSSHNKKGQNSDENWPLYVDENGDEVIFDAKGPGCIRSMWATYLDSNAVVKFYFDGEKKPRYEMNYVHF